MSSRPRLVHRPRFGEPPPVRRQPRREGVPAPPQAADREEVWPEPDRDRDAMREVQMENIHPLRLRLLLEIERTRSISAAARACGIGQPSASMHLRNLEATLGHRLVTRDGRGSTLTAAGKVVASHAARMLATLDSMRRAVDALGKYGGGELSIAASLTPSIILLPPILRQLSDRYPGMSVTLRTLPSEAASREVARGSVDLAIAGEVRTPEPLTRQQIAVDELVGIAAPGLVDPNHGWLTLGQLARNRLLLGPEGSSTRTVTERYLARVGYRPAPVWEFDTYDTIIRAVKHGLGVSFASRLLVKDDIEHEKLTTFRVSGVEQMLRPIQALHQIAKEFRPEESAFMALLADSRKVMEARRASAGTTSSVEGRGFGS